MKGKLKEWYLTSQNDKKQLYVVTVNQPPHDSLQTALVEAISRRYVKKTYHRYNTGIQKCVISFTVKSTSTFEMNLSDLKVTGLFQLFVSNITKFPSKKIEKKCKRSVFLIFFPQTMFSVSERIPVLD